MSRYFAWPPFGGGRGSVDQRGKVDLTPGEAPGITVEEAESVVTACIDCAPPKAAVVAAIAAIPRKA